MNRRAALALFAVSLTLLPACVTKVVVAPPVTEPSSTSTSTEPPTTTIAEESVAGGESANTLRRRNDSSIEEGFFRGLRATVFENRELTPNQTSALWQIALDACDYFDGGLGMLDWATANGLFDDGIVDEMESEFTWVSVAAVGAVCPEHIAVVDEMADALNEIEASQPFGE